MILTEEAFPVWLDSDFQDRNALRDLLRPCDSDLLEAYPLKRVVNNPRNDVAALADRPRPTQPEARQTAEKTEELLPMQPYKAGDVFYRLVEIRRTEAPSVQIELISFDDALRAFGATVDGQAHLTAANFAAKGDDRDVKWNGKSVAIPAGDVRLVW